MDDWRLLYDGFDPEMEGLREALCTLGNGCFASRGAAPESVADEVHYPGTYLAGGYNRLKTEIAGRIIENEDLVNMPNWLSLSFRIEGEDWFDLQKVTILSYQQELDLKQGVLHRRVRFRDGKGRHTALTNRRLVHMAYPHLAALETTLMPEDWSGRVEIRSALDGRVVNSGVRRYRNLNNKHLLPIATGRSGDAIYLKVETSQSELRVAAAARTRLLGGGLPIEAQNLVVEEPGYVAQHSILHMARGREIRVEKVAALFTSRDRAVSECGLAAVEHVSMAGSFAELLNSHVSAWKRQWDRFDIELELAPSVKPDNHTILILHLHIFHLMQTTSVHTIDLDVGVPSRGWHGEAYRGHIFWDEIFIFPLLNLRIPDITRALLHYRNRRLNAARRAARAAGYRGAMYPWQSGSDGREETQIVHLNPKSGHWLPDNSHLQRHVNAAIVYNIWQYYQVTGDLAFLCFYGSEIILEVARLFASMATYNDGLQRYEILRVMGPDEYHDSYPDSPQPGLNNNAYTNLMAVWVLCRALDLIALLPLEHCTRVLRKLQVTNEEIQHWEDISRRMRVVFQGNGIISQFEGYGDLLEFDWASHREKYGQVMRLDRILEAKGDTPNRYKASKQADVLMLFYLFSTEELEQLFTRLGYSFSPQMIPDNVEYYLQRTAHGSTLSQVVNSWVLARSDREKSWDLFTHALQSDFADVQGGTTPEGIHLGAMAGTVDLVQRGYMGIEVRQDVLWLNPRLPNELIRMRFHITYHQASLYLEVDHKRLGIKVVHCPIGPIRIGFEGHVMELKESDEIDLELPPRSPQAGVHP